MRASVVSIRPAMEAAFWSAVRTAQVRLDSVTLGDVTARNLPGGGAEFALELPLAAS